MAQFEILRLGDGLVIDCQSDLLSQLNSRFVVPLVARTGAPQIAHRLNPVFEINGKEYAMVTQAAAAVRIGDLGRVVGLLADRSFEVTSALDVLISGV